MHVSLTPELEKFIKAKVESGLYNNSSEVLREALRLLKRRDAVESAQFERLKVDIERGLEGVGRGDVHPFDVEQFVTDMRRKRAQDG